jgi:two-component system, chemotaxis family, protein-glutamate methylesterase/glutaminase
MACHDILVIGASAGGLEALKALVGALPAKLPASVLVVLHVAPHHPSYVPELLQSHSALPIGHASDNAPVEPGHIYIAPPDHHLLLSLGHMRLARGPKENRSRPSIDALFRSAAQAYGARVIGVLLTGHLDDGTAGLWAVKDRGGLAVVQDPGEAEAPSMPRSALRHVAVDQVLPLAEMGAALARLVELPAPGEGEAGMSKEKGTETKIAEEGNALALGVMGLGQLTAYTCPECNGVLVEVKEGGLLRFRCHTGHGYSVNSLLDEVTESIEANLYAVMRGIEEAALIMQQMAQRSRAEGDAAAANDFDRKIEDAKRRAEKIHEVIRQHKMELPD